MDRAIPPVSSRSSQSVEELHMENTLLRARLEDLLNQAHQNQNIMARHQSFDLKLIGSGSFRELVVNIFSALAITSELDVVTLVLIDRHQNLQKMLNDLQFDTKEFPHLQFISSEKELDSSLRCDHKPILGKYQNKLHGKLFSSAATPPASVAIVPLMRQQRMIGCLCLGSRESRRFTANMATDFIERLASIMAICLENVINNERLTYIGLTDPLTNVSNRRYVEQRLLEEIARARRQQYSIACMYLDIDFFKHINDTYGHQCGDDVLREVARRIKAELRLSDTLGRFGGEEFVVLLINTNLQDAIQVAERIRNSIAARPFALGSAENCQTTISIGLTTVEPDTSTDASSAIAHAMLARADQALYQAKHGGRNQVRSA